MSNTLATSAIVAKEALAILKNNLGFAKNVNRNWEDEFGGNMGRGYEPGQTINIRKPPRYTYRDGRVAVPQATTVSTVPLTLSQGGCDISFTSAERTVSISTQRLSEVVEAAMNPVLNEIDRRGLELARYSTYNALNPTYAAPNTQALAIAAITGVNRRLDEMAAPKQNDRKRSMALNPGLNANFITGMAGLFNNASSISKQYDTGIMVDSLGLQYFMDQNISTHTNGAGTASNVNGANQTGSTVTVAATGAGTITRGTRITLPGVFAVNPVSRQSTGVLADFIITADVPQGSTSLPISPAIVTSGPFQNVTASPTTGQPFVIFGAASTSYACNVGYHRDAFTLACVPLAPVPAGTGAKSYVATDENLSVRVTEGFDITNDNSITRIDVLYGYAATYPELACVYAI
jgi:hypothetical protein